MRWKSHILTFAGAAALAVSSPSWAAQPQPGQIGFQEPASPVMHEIVKFHNGPLMWMAVGVSLFVLALLLINIFLFNKRMNKTPRKFSHNTLLEVVWTAVPVLILVALFLPSIRLLYLSETVPDDVALTIKATGYQWYWGYEYPDQGGFEYFANMVAEEDLGEDAFGGEQPRLLATDNDVVVPVGQTVRMIVTASDVIHNWAMPAFGIKTDAIPGRLNETWFKAEREGMFYGQCSELCGVRHAFMPISVRVVSQREFDAWVAAKQREAGLPVTVKDEQVAMADTGAASSGAPATAQE